MNFVIAAALASLLATGVQEGLAEEPREELLTEFVAALKDPARLDEGLNDAAAKDAATWCATAKKIASKEEAEKHLRDYVSTELKYVGHSYKLGLTGPLDTYRVGCSSMLAHLQSVYGSRPSYNWLEKKLLWLEATSRED